MGRQFGHIDWVSAIIILCISSLGLFVLLSIQPVYFSHQLFYLALGVGVCLLVSRIHPAVFHWATPGLYVFSLSFLALVYTFPKVRGSHRWVFIGSEQIQPSEFVKPLLLLMFSYLIAKFPPRRLRYVLLHFFVFLLPFLLVFRQPDLGTSIVIFVMWLSAMIAGGLPVKSVMAASLIGFFVMPVFWEALAPYQQARIRTFLEPGLDPRGAGYNALQAMIAVGSGQMLGKGLGLGTQSHLRFLPEYHTDFIFATLVEELGFVGGATLLIAYLFLCWRILLPLFRLRIQDVFVFVFTIGFTVQLLSQVFVNAGMNMGILPITGITMPFVSYGGSSILSLGLSFGILWSLQAGSKRENEIVATS